MVTVYHWDMPQALEDAYHGWENRRIVDDYVQYATTYKSLIPFQPLTSHPLYNDDSDQQLYLQSLP